MITTTEKSNGLCLQCGNRQKLHLSIKEFRIKEYGGDVVNQKSIALLGLILGLLGLFIPMLAKKLFYFDIQSIAGVLFGYSAALLVQRENKEK